MGLLVALPEMVKLWIGSDSAYGVPTIWPNQFGIYHFSDYAIDGNEIATIIATVVSVVGLTLLFRYSSIGLRMRAVVESPRMTALAGHQRRPRQRASRGCCRASSPASPAC